MTLSRSTRRLVVVAIAVFLYLPSLSFGFVYDDAAVVERQSQVTGQAWGAILVSPYHVGPDERVATGLYRPLTILSLALNHALSGLRPWSYHLVNVVLHALAALLVLEAADALRAPPLAGLTGAILFAVHPVHVEAVANVSGRAELLSTVFALAALVAYLRSARRADTFDAKGAVLVALFTAAAVFSKENALTLLGIVALWELLQSASWRRKAIGLASLAFPIVVYLAARALVLGRLSLPPTAVTPIENPIVGLAAVPRAATVLGVFTHAVSLVLTPVRLSPDYGFADTMALPSLASIEALTGAVLLFAIAGGVIVAWKRAPLVAFALGGAVTAYAIVSNAFVVIGTILGDRLLYFPSVFVCLALGLAAAWCAESGRPRSAVFAVAAVALVFTVRSAIYVPKWKSDDTLFEYAARAAPASVRCVGAWGARLAERGDLVDGRRLLDRAVTLAPDFIPNLLNRAAAAMAAGDLDAARRDATHVLELDPDDAVARRQLAAIGKAAP